MKTIRLFGVALMTVLLSVGFSSCSKSDDGNGAENEVSASIEGKWYVKTINWYKIANGKPTNTISSTENFGDYSDKWIWEITQNGDKLIIKNSGRERDTSTYSKISGNTYKNNNLDLQITIKSVTQKQLVVEWYLGVSETKDDEIDYAIFTLMR